MNKRLWLDYTRLRAALDFGAVLSHYQIEYPAGRDQLKIHCPFHQDDDPSLSINVSGGKWQCFGCDAKGNTLEFVTRMEGLDPEDKEGLYAGAERALAIMGADPASFRKADRPEKAPGSPRKDKKGQKRLESRPTPTTPRSGHPVAPHEPPTLRKNPPLDLTLTLEPAHPFLEARGIAASVAREFGLGYCARGLMKERIAIPIHDETGQLIAYAGRYAATDLPTDTERYRLPKGFEKSLVLYNLHRAKTLGKRHLVLVEGYWSAIRLHQVGIPVAACLGHSVSPEQAALLPAAGFRFVTLLFDGDEAGRQGALAALPVLASHVYVRILTLPEGEKPDTMPESWFEHLR